MEEEKSPISITELGKELGESSIGITQLIGELEKHKFGELQGLE